MLQAQNRRRTRRWPTCSPDVRLVLPNNGWQQLEVDPVKGQVDINVDMAGQVFLRGLPPAMRLRREIEDAARSVPGVTSVFSQLEVIPRRAPADADNPPPPPVPEPVAGWSRSDDKPRVSGPGHRARASEARAGGRAGRARLSGPDTPRRRLARTAARCRRATRQGALCRRRGHPVRPGPFDV